MKSREDVIRGLNEEVKRADYIDTEYLDCVEVSVLRDALALLKQQGPKGKAYWIQRAGRGHGWNCSNCGEKISYNEEQKTRQKRVLPVWLVNKYCRGCGREMTYPPAHE